MFSDFDSFEVGQGGTLENQSSATSILLVEDDSILNPQLTSLLKSDGYRVTSTDCGNRALAILQQKKFDLAILDIQLPNIDGLSLLHFIREHHDTPVILLTAYAAEEHRIRGLKSGADDYISKPCNFTELSLRVDAILRRTQKRTTASKSTELSSHELTLNKSVQSTFVANEDGRKTIDLTPIQFKLLWTLVHNRGSIQTKPYLYQTVLEREFSPYDRSLDMHLSRIRKRLVEAGLPSQRIQTIHGKGYLFQ
ncbi:response regulator transcription factor [uncultured Vibrio sp.]|uniref:response regulator transcription factor n=1 Tax=uncultured Vibrio sp. TaxID=114054 RepID=UPI0025F44D9F|nr:response regulator transcription factor [uncultured Vibrio sp.]